MNEQVAQHIQLVRQEHRQIGEMLKSIERVLDFYPEDPAPRCDVESWINDIESEVSALADRLETHCRTEESSAMYTTLPEDLPDYRDDIQRLQREHRSILLLIRTIRDELSPTIRPDHLSELVRRAHHVVGTIRRHEKTETSILKRAYSAHV